MRTLTIITHFNMIFCRIFRLFSVRTSQTTKGLYSTRKLEVTYTVSSTLCVSTFGQLYFRCKNAAHDRNYVILAKKTKPWIVLRNCYIAPCCVFGRHCNWTLMKADGMSSSVLVEQCCWMPRGACLNEFKKRSVSVWPVHHCDLLLWYGVG